MEPTLKIDVQPLNTDQNYQTILFSGDFDKAGFSEIRESLDKALEDFLGREGEAAKSMIFDFGKLKYINSQGIGVLMEIHAKMAEKDRKLVIIGANDNVKDVFQAIGLNEIIASYDSMDGFLNQ